MASHHFITLVDVAKSTPPELFEETRELLIPHIKNIHSLGGLTNDERDVLLEQWERKYDEFEEIE